MLTESEANAASAAANRDDELEILKSENEQMRRKLGRRLRWRSALAFLLVILSSLSVVTSTVAVWVRQVAFDTDRFMATVEPALGDPNFYVLIGDRASASVLDALAVEARLAESLEALDAYLSDALVDALELDARARDILERFDRPSLAGLATPIAAAVEDRVDAGIHAFFSSERFTTRFPELVRRSHEAAVALARDELADLPNVYVAEGEVRLNLIPFIAEALRQVGDEIRAVLPDFDLPDVIDNGVAAGREQLGNAIEARLPEDFGQITVMSESALSEVQDVVALLDRYVWGLVLLSLALLFLTVAVSPNRRRTALQLGVGVFLAVVIASVAVRRLQSAIVEQIVDPTGSAVAEHVVRDALSSLRTLQLLIAAAAILVAILAYFAGRPVWFTRLTDSARAWTEPEQGVSRMDMSIAHNAGTLQVAGVLIAGVALFFTGLDLISIIVIGVVLGGYLWWISAAVKRTGTQDADNAEADQEVGAGPVA